MTLKEAIALAEQAHAGQIDKGGEPYIRHPMRVMRSVRGLHAKMAAVLHDVVEDTGITLEELRRRGCPEAVVRAVDAVTKREGEPLDDYYARVAADPLALIVKRADIADNSSEPRLARLPRETAQRLREKYRHAIEVLNRLSPEAQMGL